jgi:hypothetical protein
VTAFLEFIKSIVGLLNIPAIISDNVVSFFEKNGVNVPLGARPWFALLISLFVCVIPYVYDRLRGSISKIVFWYGVLYAILCALVISINYYGAKPILYALQGNVTALSAEVSSKEFIQHFESTAGCSDRTSPIRRVCAPNFMIQSHNITIVSANCGSRIVSEALDPADNKCLIVQESVQGCGEDNILGIKNCRGRGWLNYDVTVAGSAPNSTEVLHQNFNGTLSKDNPFGKVFDLALPAENVRWQYRVIISQGTNQLAVLTDQTSSSDLFRSSMSNGLLRVDLIHPTNQPGNP